MGAIERAWFWLLGVGFFLTPGQLNYLNVYVATPVPANSVHLGSVGGS